MDKFNHNVYISQQHPQSNCDSTAVDVARVWLCVIWKHFYMGTSVTVPFLLIDTMPPSQKLSDETPNNSTYEQVFHCGILCHSYYS